MTNALSIGTSAIRTHKNLYSLNDLHRASGSEARHQPNRFVRLEQTKELIAEISNAGISAIQSVRGGHGGTYACKELVIAYAAWISAAFHLKVIRVFLAQQATTPATLGYRRFLVSYENGKEQIQALDISDCVLKYADLPKLITARDNRLTTDFLMAVQGACVQRLVDNEVIANQANRQLRAALLGNKKLVMA